MADVMAITKRLIPVPTVSGFTVSPRELSQRGRTSDWMVRAGLVEKDMSKTSNATRERELTEAELDQVAGGTPSIPIPPPTSYAIGRIEPRFPPVKL
jgi:hypothetical protein